MAHVNPMAVAAALIAHIATGLSETLVDASDAKSIKEAPDAFTAYQVGAVEVQDGMAVMDTAVYLIPVTVYDVRTRTGGTETDVAVGARLAQIADLATDYAAWRGDLAVVRCDAARFTVATDDEMSEAFETQRSVTAGSVQFQVVVLV